MVLEESSRQKLSLDNLAKQRPLKCPRCGKRGSYQPKSVKGHTYWYFAHSEPLGKLRWCYVGKKRPKET